MGERRAKPSRAPVCGHDRPTQSLRMSDWLRAVRDVRPTRLAGWAAVRARGSTGAHPTRTPQRRDRRLEAALGAAVGTALIPAIGACAFRGASALICLGTIHGDVLVHALAVYQGGASGGRGQIATTCQFNDAWCQQHWYDPSLRGFRIEFAYQCGPHGLNMRGQLGVDL